MQQNKKNEGLNREEIVAFSSELKVYLKKELSFNHETLFIDHTNIYFKNGQIDIMIRWFSYHQRYYPNAITIARISFFEERKGYGSKLITFLSLIAKKYSYDTLILESCNKAAELFAIKHGFKEIIDDNTDKDYVLLLDK